MDRCADQGGQIVKKKKQLGSSRDIPVYTGDETLMLDLHGLKHWFKEVVGLGPIRGSSFGGWSKPDSFRVAVASAQTKPVASPGCGQT
jgi:hypothetical protein